jgi:hypothetical protein
VPGTERPGYGGQRPLQVPLVVRQCATSGP